VKRSRTTAFDEEVEELVCACASVRRASRAVTQLYDSWLRDHGIEGAQFALLAMLDRLGETNQATMGQRVDLDKTTLSRNLKLLQHRVALTAAGRRQLATARPAWRRAQQHLQAGMNEHQWDMMWKVFVALTRAARVAARGSASKRRAK
jgi:DNA-binding MarR family transcriptional regulator